MSLADTTRRLRDITGGSRECGWMCDEVAAFIHALVRFHRPDLVIQTGHLWGKSAAAVLEAFGPPDAIEDQPQDGDAKFSAFVGGRRPAPLLQQLISIDPHPMGVPHWREGIAYLTEKFGDAFHYANQTSREFFAEFRPSHPSRIMGIVDGDHTDAGCMADLESLGKLGADLIVVDDVLWLPTLANVAHKFAFRSDYSVNVFKVYNGIAVLTRE